MKYHIAVLGSVFACLSREAQCWITNPSRDYRVRHHQRSSRSWRTIHVPLLQNRASAMSIDSISEDLVKALEGCKNDVTKICKVMVAPVGTDRLGLIATQSISKGDVVLAIPYDDSFTLTGNLARTKIFQDVLPKSYDSWTGDVGLIALSILNEVVRASSLLLSSTTVTTVPSSSEPKRSPAIQTLMESWIRALPGPSELNHPLLWKEEDQEILQSSSTNKVYRMLDDLEDDVTWLIENVFSKDRERFPESVEWNGQMIPCYCVQGFKWAMAIAQSRSFFLDGTLQLIPILDMCNHSDDAVEVQHGTMGTFGTTKGARLVAAKSYAKGDEVFTSYGPKSAADYLLEHGFCPEQCWNAAVSELSFELDSEDRFYDDKLDILEYETYDQAPMDPSQSFDVVSAPGRDGEPDRAMIQFVRLCKLGGTDAFLLESIFRKEVWGFMELPVSEKNELDVINTIIQACQRALDDLSHCPSGGPDICTKLRESEVRALTRTMEYLAREREALDLKEYYQERRLKDLGLDSDWSPEVDVNPDISFGQTRAPGGADYDW